MLTPQPSSHPRWAAGKICAELCASGLAASHSLPCLPVLPAGACIHLGRNPLSLYTVLRKNRSLFSEGRRGLSKSYKYAIKYQNAAKTSKMTHPGVLSRNLSGNTPGLAAGCRWGPLASPGCVTLYHVWRHSWVAPHNVMTLLQVLRGTWVAPHSVCCLSEQGAI